MLRYYVVGKDVSTGKRKAENIYTAMNNGKTKACNIKLISLL